MVAETVVHQILHNILEYDYYTYKLTENKQFFSEIAISFTISVSVLYFGSYVHVRL